MYIIKALLVMLLVMLPGNAFATDHDLIAKIIAGKMGFEESYTIPPIREVEFEAEKDNSTTYGMYGLGLIGEKEVGRIIYIAHWLEPGCMRDSVLAHEFVHFFQDLEDREFDEEEAYIIQCWFLQIFCDERDQREFNFICVY